MHHQQYAEKSNENQLPTIWRIPDRMWHRIQPLLPPEKEPGTPGRPAIPLHKILDGILYVLRTGYQWKAVPQEFGSGSTVHRRFQQWQQAGIMKAIAKLMLNWYDRFRALIGNGNPPMPNCCQRRLVGIKPALIRPIWANQAPKSSFYLSTAHRHDKLGLPILLDTGWLISRPKPTQDAPQHLCLDKGYDAVDIDELVDELGYQAHIKPQGEVDEPGLGEPIYPARRRKVERSISWLNNMRKLRVRWEKKACNYQALWLFAASLLIFRLIIN